MSQCTAPVKGHRTASAAANCPACRGGGRSSRYRSFAPSYPSYTPSADSGSGHSSYRSPRTARPNWSPSSSSVNYAPAEVRALAPIRESIESQGTLPDRWDVFLCHAWDDRQGAAQELNDLLEAVDVTVWFSEKNVLLGTPLLREIDKGLAKSRAGLVLVTPAFLRRLNSAGIAEKELSALLARERLVRYSAPEAG